MTIEEVNNQLRQRGATSKSVATKAPAQPATTSKLNIETLRRRIAEARQQFTVAINEANKLGQLTLKRRIWSLGLQLGALEAELNRIFK